MAANPPMPGVLDTESRVGAVPGLPPTLRLGATVLPTVGSVRIYVCGITPYDVTHLGHASTFVWSDVLSSVVKAAGTAPRVCRNVTDVDDVLTSAARQRGRHFDELALLAEASFEQSMRALRVATPDAQPRARHTIAAVQQLAAALLSAGAAYERDGTVWFRGSDVPATVGVEPGEALRLASEHGDDPEDPAKQDPFDVPVWRPSDDGDPAWPSPWGWGRPGWHAECAAMAMSVHGPGLDVLVGGEDLAFPHHAHQAAMAIAATAVTPFARASMHVGEVRYRGAKMAKSTGNLVLVDDLLVDWSPAVVRTALLDRRYEEPWEFTQSVLVDAQSRLDRVFAAAGHSAADPVAAQEARARLFDDLDVPGALDLAERAGGDAARQVLSTLRLS